MTTGRINQVIDRRSFRRGSRLGARPARNSPPHPPEPAVEPLTTVRLYPWRRLPDRSPNVNSPQTAGHCRRLLPRTQHTGKARTQTNCGECLPFSASTARIQRTKAISHRSHRQPTRFFGRSLPPAGDVASVRPAQPEQSRLQRMRYPDHRQGRTCVGARRESRDDLCSFPHDLPGITAGLLSLTFWRNVSPFTVSFRHSHSPRLSRMSVVTTTRQTVRQDLAFFVRRHCKA